MPGETAAQERTKTEDHEVTKPGQNVELRGHGVYLRLPEYETADTEKAGMLGVCEALELVQGNRAKEEHKRHAKLELEAAKEEHLLDRSWTHFLHRPRWHA